MRIVPCYPIVRADRGASVNKRRRDPGMVPSAEAMETRQLLSFLNPFGNKFTRVRSGGVLDVITVSGPGQVFTRNINHQSIAITLAGTTQDSQVTISSLGAHPGTLNHPLQIACINVKTGRLGSFNAATTGDLNGPLSPLIGPVNSLQFDALGPGAQINVNGNLGTLTVNRGVDLGPTGLIDVTNDLTSAFSVSRNVTLQGGQIKIERDMAGAVTIGGNLAVYDGGLFSVGRNLSGTSSGAAVATGGATISGNLALDSNGKLTVGGNASTLSIGGNIEASTGGGITITGNLGSLTMNGGSGSPVTGNLTLNPGGLFSVGGNLNSLSVGSDLQVFQGSTLNVTGNLTSLSVGGNVQTSQSPPQTVQGNPQPTPGGQIHVGANLGTLAVTGLIQGKGSEDIVVGDNLGQLTVLGGGPAGFGLQGVDLDVAKNIQGLDVRNGVAHSRVTAGILIDGGTPGAGSSGWNIGPDGAVAVLDSLLTAGFEIRNLTIGGDVVSDLPQNPSGGRPTRIVAGEDRNGNFSPGGIIDNFQIVGRLVDAAVAASVQPYGGTGAAPPTPTPPSYVPPTSTSDDNGFKTYDEPAGSMTVGGVMFPTYTAPPYDPASDPTIDDLVLPGGAINPSLAPSPSASSSLPARTTVLGGVVSTSHGDNADFAGLFAANTKGVFVGPSPTK
jgi:hypothetical protein